MIEEQQTSMSYRLLGKSQLNISRIGFGCMSLQPGQADTQFLIDKAIEGGINYFDTADLYDKGLNEINVGKALAGKRNKIIIATKVGNQWRPDGSGWDWNPGKKYILNNVEQSLSRLKTDYIDLYQLHGGTIEDPIDETIEAFELLQQQGKIRYYGISSIRPNVIREYVRRSNIVSVMMQYSLLDRRPEETCLTLLQEHGIGVLARGAVAGGLLAGKPPKPYLAFTAPEVAAAAKVIEEASSEESNAAATALRFVLQHPAITAAVVGIRTENHLKDALQAIGAGPLLSTQMKAIIEPTPQKYYEQHR
ncbi:MAG: oxidoreductase [Ferruginibacter sp.]|nr:oxidoreductase [Ferruginibacter sp.]